MEKQDPKQHINVSEYHSLVGECLDRDETAKDGPQSPTPKKSVKPAASALAAPVESTMPTEAPFLKQIVILLICSEGLALVVWLLVLSTAQPALNGSAAAMELRQKLGADNAYWELAGQLKSQLRMLPPQNLTEIGKALSSYNLQTRTPDDGYDESFQEEDLKPEYLRINGSAIDYSE